MPKQISTMEALKKEADGERDPEFFILLNGYLRSSKRIIWDEKDQLFYILNYIDDTEQELTEAQLMDRDYTNIGYAMTKGALFKMVEVIQMMKAEKDTCLICGQDVERTMDGDRFCSKCGWFEECDEPATTAVGWLESTNP